MKAFAKVSPCVCLLGPINIDITLPIDKYPSEGGDGLCDSYSIETGGVVANTAIVLAKLGAKAQLIGCMGDDTWAEMVSDAFDVTGVDVSGVSTIPGLATGLNIAIVTPSGERTFFNAWGANNWVEPETFPLDLIARADMLQVTGHPVTRESNRSVLLEAIDIARSANVPVSMDTSLRPVMEQTSEILSLIPQLAICVVGYEEGRHLTDEQDPYAIARNIVSRGPNLAAVKLGGGGCIVATAEEHTMLTTHEVTTLDTTGAGDSFTAGIIFGWLSQMSIGATAMLANLLGALATTVWGAGTKLPGADNVITYLSSMDYHDRSEHDAHEITLMLKASQRLHGSNL